MLLLSELMLELFFYFANFCCVQRNDFGQKRQSIKTKKEIDKTLPKSVQIVYNCIDKQKFFPEEIKNTGLDSAALLSALTELEMEMLIRALPGGMYEKCEL